MESWDDDNFEPEVQLPVKAAASNKWEGEDEEDEIKESWEDEEEEKENEKQNSETEKAAIKPKKKSIAEKIAEKERLKREELERRKREAEEEDISAEEKLRRQKESDLNLALETTFGSEDTCPNTTAEFDEFANILSKKLQPLSKSSEYPGFAENLIRNICATLSSFDLKKIKITIDNLYLEKQKLEKGDKVKKNKGKGKVKLKVEDSNQYSAYAVDDYDEFDDFM